MRASEPLRVLGDGRAARTGKGRTGIRSLPRQPCPHMQDRPPRPTSRQGIAKQAESHKGYRVRNREGRRDADVLQQGWRAMRQDAATGGIR